MQKIRTPVDEGEFETLEQRYDGYRFGFQTKKNASLDDIDESSVYQFIDLANSVRNLNQSTFLPVEDLLEKLDLTIKGEITNAALLLFGKNPGRFFPGHYEVKCGYFPSDEGYTVITNDKEYDKNIIENFNFSFGFVKDCLRKTTVKEKVQRTETWEFPESVIREALVNMIVHRDYRQGIKSTVEVRPSFISFYNVAHLFKPAITIERLKEAHPSRPGNRLIAKIFYLMGLLENWGGGTTRIISETVESGHVPPEFSFEGGMFRLELYRRQDGGPN